MTGKLLASSEGKSKPSSDGGSSDEEKTAMLGDQRKDKIDDKPSNQRLRGLLQKCMRPWFPQRFILCFLAHFGFLALYIMRSNMSVAIVKMTTPYALLDGDRLISKVDFDWNMKDQGILLSSFFFGYILTQIPGGYLAVRCGGRKVFGIGVFLASMITFLTPTLGMNLGFYGLLFARILCGVFEGVTYPAIHAMWNYWAPPAERTILVSGAFSGAYLGAALSMSQDYGYIPGTSGSWQTLFYLSGGFGFIWSFLWFSYGAEYPDTDYMVSDSELRYLSESAGSQRYNTTLPIPWLKIMLSYRVWAICVCHFAANWGFYTLLTELPTFMKYALNMEANSSHGIAAVPFLTMYVAALFGGYLVDKTVMRCLSVTNTRKVTVAITFLTQMMFFFYAGKATETHEYMICIIGAMFFGGLSWSGFSANHLDIAPEYASILLGITNTFGTIPGIVSPIITGYLVEKKEDLASWSVVFLLTGYIYLAAAVFYVMFGTGQLQDWAHANESVKLNSSQKQTKSSDVESTSD